MLRFGGVCIAKFIDQKDIKISHLDGDLCYYEDKNGNAFEYDFATGTSKPSTQISWTDEIEGRDALKRSYDEFKRNVRLFEDLHADERDFTTTMPNPAGLYRAAQWYIRLVTFRFRTGSVSSRQLKAFASLVRGVDVKKMRQSIEAIDLLNYNWRINYSSGLAKENGHGKWCHLPIEEWLRNIEEIGEDDLEDDHKPTLTRLRPLSR